MAFDGSNFVTLSYGGDLCASYGGVFFVAIGQTLRWLVNSVTWYSRDLGATITALTEWDSALWVGTEGGLFRAAGRLMPRDPVNNLGTLDYFEVAIGEVFGAAATISDTAHPQGRNFYGMCGFDGWLWFWLAGRVWRGRFSMGQTDANGAGHFLVEPQPIFGSNRGMAICGGLIVAALKDSSYSTLWVYDPMVSGWWALERGKFHDLSCAIFALELWGWGDWGFCRRRRECEPLAFGR